MLVGGTCCLNRKLLEISALGKKNTAVIILKEDILLRTCSCVFLLCNYLGLSWLSVLFLNLLKLCDNCSLQLNFITQSFTDIRNLCFKLADLLNSVDNILSVKITKQR